MSNSIVKITPAFDFNNTSCILVFTPSKGAGVIGSYSWANTDSVDGVTFANYNTVNTQENPSIFEYLPAISAYRISLVNITGSTTTIGTTPSVASSGYGVFSIKFTGEDEVLANYSYRQNGLSTTRPLGVALLSFACVLGKSQVYAQVEAKQPDNSTSVLANGMMLKNNANSTIYSGTPYEIRSGIHFKTFDLGLIDGGLLISLKAIGNGGISGGDFIDVDVTIPSCPCPILVTPIASTKDAVNACPILTVNLNAIISNATPVGATLVWFENNTHTGTPYATPTLATNGYYYPFFYDTASQCYSGAGDKVVVTIDSCEPPPMQTPTVTQANLCKKACDYQRKITGTSNFIGAVAIFVAPYKNGDVPIAVGYSSGSTWTASSSLVNTDTEYLAYGISETNVVGLEALISTIQNCEKICVLTGTFKGEVIGVQSGIIQVDNYPIPTIPIYGVISNGKFDIKSDKFVDGKKYTLKAIRINEKI